MKAILKAPQKLGNRVYPQGEQVLPDSLALNLAFKALVAKGAIQVLPRDIASQQVQMFLDAKAALKAKHKHQAARKAREAQALAKATNEPEQEG